MHQAGDRVILHQAGAQPAEIELVPPVETAAAPQPLPEPVCPEGVPASYDALPEELPPGVSAIDDYLRARDAGELHEEGGQP